MVTIVKIVKKKNGEHSKNGNNCQNCRKNGEHGKKGKNQLPCRHATQAAQADFHIEFNNRKWSHLVGLLQFGPSFL